MIIAPQQDLFEEAVEHIKKHEGWHTDAKHVGYGHVIKKGERFQLPITKEQGDSILRADLRESISHFRHLGSDSLLIGVLAYNIGVYRLKGDGRNLKKSTLIRKLESGDRNIKQEFLSYRKWNGKVIKSIENRRRKEIELFYDTTHQPRHTKQDS
ncbi:MAG: lysozyme [Bacteroidales bacterium]